VRTSVFHPLIGFGLAAIGLTAILYLFGLGFRPDVMTAPLPPDPDLLAEVQEARKLTLNRSNPPRLQRDVDYSQGAAAPWWPKGEAPVLAELVAEAKLPKVAERVGPEPVVLAGVEGTGRYGGTWQRLAVSNASFRGQSRPLVS